jgi:hypothetical protein
MSLNSSKIILINIRSQRIVSSEHNHLLISQKEYQYFP